MSWLSGKTLSVQCASALAILVIGVVGLHGTSLADGPDCPTANRAAAIRGNSIVICDAPTANSPGALSESPVAVENKPVVSRDAPQEPSQVELRPDHTSAGPGEPRDRTEILSDKVDDLFQAMAATQRESRTLQERVEAEGHWAEAERASQREVAEQIRLLAEVRHQRQQEQALEQREQTETLNENVDSVLRVVASDVKQILQATQDVDHGAQSDQVAQQQRPEAEDRQVALAPESQRDTLLSRAILTADGRLSDTSYLLLGGLVVVIVAVCWYIARSIRVPVDKVTGVLEVVGADVKKILRTPYDQEPWQERTKAERSRFLQQARKQSRRAEPLGAVAPARKVAPVGSVDAENVLQAMRHANDPRQHEGTAQQGWPKLYTQDLEIGGARVDSPKKVATASAKVGSPKGVEFRVAPTMGEAPTSVQEMLAEVSKRTRELEQSAAARCA